MTFNTVFDNKHRAKGRGAHQVMTLEFTKKTVKDMCRTRNDELGDILLGRLNMRATFLLPKLVTIKTVDQISDPDIRLLTFSYPQ